MYSASNRLREPHNYMYTPFEGKALLQAYFDARVGAMSRFESMEAGAPADDPESSACAAAIGSRLARWSPGTHGYWCALFGAEAGMGVASPYVDVSDGAKRMIKKFSPSRRVATSDLLRALVGSLLEEGWEAETIPWLDRVIQRFEVTKRLYESYPAGFRKGEGPFDSPRRYWLFSLALCLLLSRSENLRALNALLKVCDLLCSLDTNVIRKEVSGAGMRLVLATECASVRSLLDRKGISNASG